MMPFKPKVISIVNMKGGVGKTTLAIALTDYFAAFKKEPVCLVDLDAQSNASFAMCGEERYEAAITSGKTIDRFFLRNGQAFGGAPLDEFLHKQVSSLEEQPPISLVASSPRLRLVERQLLIKLARTRLFDQELEGRAGAALREGFDEITAGGSHVIVDSAPGISGFSVAALKASDIVIAPVNPDYLSRIGLDLLGREIIQKLPKEERPKLYAVLTRVAGNQVYARLNDFRDPNFQASAGFALLDTIVPQRAALQRIVSEGDLVQSFSQKYGDGLEAVLRFGEEVNKLIQQP